jgi:hypothetical protein
MKTLAVSFSILAVAALAGCGAPYYAPAQNERAAPIVPQAVSYRPGFGWVQSVVLTPSPMGSASGGTATGASAHPAGTAATDRPEPRVGVPSSSAGRLNRLAIRMDAGGDIQYVDTDSNEFKQGMRVELTPDRMIRKVQ